MLTGRFIKALRVSVLIPDQLICCKVVVILNPANSCDDIMLGRERGVGTPKTRGENLKLLILLVAGVGLEPTTLKL